MKLNPKKITASAAAMIATVATVAALTLSSAGAFAADKDMHEDRAQQRIANMHVRLSITPAQEAQWKVVADVMRENGKVMDQLTQQRVDKSKEMNAVDDLKSYAAITDAHADGLHKLIPAFAVLYSSMSDIQKKQADTMFKHGENGRVSNKSADKAGGK